MNGAAARSSVVVFGGPSLHGLDAAGRALLERCDLWPPAGRGDVLRALATQPRALVLIDGYFHRVPAVTHQELLYALDAGVPVLGAASMGALRAAELERFGMTGVGRVFAAYRDGTLDGDDEVALLHAPAEYGYAPVGVALVEVRFALERLDGELAGRASRVRALLEALKALVFSARSPERLAGLARELLGEPLAQALRRELDNTSVKRQDACAGLAAGLRAAASRRDGEAQPRRRAATGYLTCFKEIYLPAPAPAPASAQWSAAPGATLARALQAALVLHPQAADLVRALRRRAIRAAAAAQAGIVVPDADLAARAAWLRSRHELTHGAAFLPAPEYASEARIQLLSERSDRGGGLSALARRFGCLESEPAAAETALLGVFESQPDLLPAWDAARAFAFSPALAAAAATASAAGEVLACLGRARGGARIEPQALFDFAAELWRCDSAGIAAVAASRGLFPAAGLADGLREALELLAPAERLARSINDYPAARAALLASMLRLLDGGEMSESS